MITWIKLAKFSDCMNFLLSLEIPKTCVKYFDVLLPQDLRSNWFVIVRLPISKWGKSFSVQLQKHYTHTVHSRYHPYTHETGQMNNFIRDGTPYWKAWKKVCTNVAHTENSKEYTKHIFNTYSSFLFSFYLSNQHIHVRIHTHTLWPVRSHSLSISVSTHSHTRSLFSRVSLHSDSMHSVSFVSYFVWMYRCMHFG